jgi:putative DNA primase/helicase
MWEILASPWFTDAPLQIHDKGAVEVIHGKWVIELAEMDALSKYESQTMKGFLSRSEDRCRMAYERSVKSYPRQNIFVGSLNPEQTGWLKDKTGNRRYWPIEVVNINLKELKNVRDALWAEAVMAFRQGEQIYVDDPRMQEIMRQEVGSRMQEDPWCALIESHLHEHADEYVEDGYLVVMPGELYTRVIGGNAAMFKYIEANRIAAILKLLGFEKSKSPDKIGYVYKKKYVGEI